MDYKLTGVSGPSSTQEAVFEKAMLDSGLLEAFLERGNNVMFFGYGQTGSGKTHTMLGETASLGS